jgi:hypothetical protein
MPLISDLIGAFKRLNWQAGLYTRGVLPAVACGLVAIFFLWTQTIVIAGLQKTKPPRDRLVAKTVIQIPVIDSSEPRWCYDGTPELLFFSGRTLFSSALDGNITKLVQLDRAIDGRSLSCSRDGRLIFFRSDLHDFVYLYRDGRLAVYAVKPSLPGNIRYGSLLSPNGDVLALPNEPHLVSGPDLLRDKRVLGVRYLDIFWTRREVYVGRDTENYDVLSIETLDKVGSLFVGNRLVDEIVDCGGDTRMMTYLDPANERHGAYLSADGLSVDSSQIYDDVGAITSSGEVCVLPVLEGSSEGREAMGHLVMIAAGRTENVKISRNRILDDRFVISKDSNYLAFLDADLSDSAGQKGKMNILKIGRVNP